MAGRERRELVEYARGRLARQLAQRGEPAEAVATARGALAPDVLTLGFARRMTEYKRATLLLRDQDRLVRLLANPTRPVQIIVAGKAHPGDDTGRDHVRQWAEFVQRPDVRGRAVFLEDYDIALAQELVQGVDVWINTPRRPLEASGTSGMKLLVNGGLNLSTLDGWWVEAYSARVGWALGNATDERPTSDEEDAEQVYGLLESAVVPEFYARDADGIPRRWIARMRASLGELTPRFSSNRMLREYVDGPYRRARTAFAERCAAGTGVTRELRRWHDDLAAAWPGVRVSDLVSRRDGDAWVFTVQVHLGDARADAIAVEIYADAVGAQPATVTPTRRGAELPAPRRGFEYHARIRTERPHTDFTPRVVAHHSVALVPSEAPFIRWWSDPAQR